MQVKSFFDKDTATISHIIIDETTNKCAIVDPVYNFDLNSGRLTTTSPEELIGFIIQHNLSLEWILETHAHADHLTAANYIKSQIGGKIAIGDGIKQLIEYWTPIFNTGADTPKSGAQFDKLFKDKETFNIGNLEAKVITTPGHTPDSISYIVEDTIFVGDVIFMPYLGTGRADFPGGSAEDIYDSIQKIYALPDTTKIYMCHDYPAKGENPEWISSVGEQKEHNKLITKNTSKKQFIALRNARDKQLAVPRLLLPSIQTNIRAGKLNDPDGNKISYIKIPINKI